MVSLPLAIFQFVKSPEPTMIARGFGTAAVLMVLVLTLFVIARIIGGMTPEKSARARARRAEFFGWFASTARNLTSTIRRRTPTAKEPS
jgi:phosphate transport system permease protein